MVTIIYNIHSKVASGRSRLTITLIRSIMLDYSIKIISHNHLPCNSVHTAFCVPHYTILTIIPILSTKPGLQVQAVARVEPSGEVVRWGQVSHFWTESALLNSVWLKITKTKPKINTKVDNNKKSPGQSLQQHRIPSLQRKWGGGGAFITNYYITIIRTMKLTEWGMNGNVEYIYINSIS